jgi:hypothetical protein
VLPELAVRRPAPERYDAAGGAVTALREATRGTTPALWHHIRGTPAGWNCQTSRTMGWTSFTGANTKRGTQLRDALRVGMRGDRSFEQSALPELEGAEGG